MPEVKKSKSVKKTRVLIVDDHPMIREWLSALLNKQADMEVCAEASTAHEALELIEKHDPAIAVVDLSLEKSSGLDLIKDIKVRQPKLPVLVLSMHDESLYAERALRAGARGFVTKREATETIIAAIRKVLQGELHVSDAIAARLLRQAVGSPAGQTVSPVERLSDRELEVFRLIGRGFPNRQIAEILHLDVKTIESYRTRVKEKLGLETATDLLQHAIRWVHTDGSSST